jgi:hypothetical protein
MNKDIIEGMIRKHQSTDDKEINLILKGKIRELKA